MDLHSSLGLPPPTPRFLDFLVHSLASVQLYMTILSSIQETITIGIHTVNLVRH